MIETIFCFGFVKSLDPVPVLVPNGPSFNFRFHFELGKYCDVEIRQLREKTSDIKKIEDNIQTKTKLFKNFLHPMPETSKKWSAIFLYGRGENNERLDISHLSGTWHTTPDGELLYKNQTGSLDVAVNYQPDNQSSNAHFPFLVLSRVGTNGTWFNGLFSVDIDQEIISLLHQIENSYSQSTGTSRYDILKESKK
jgi:hypothetical protein